MSIRINRENIRTVCTRDLLIICNRADLSEEQQEIIDLELYEREERSKKSKEKLMRYLKVSKKGESKLWN